MIDAEKAGVSMMEAIAGTDYAWSLEVQKVYFNGCDVTDDCTAAFMPALPDYVAHGWMELRMRDKSGHILLEDDIHHNGVGDIVRERKKGLVSWERRYDHTQTQP